MFDGDNAFVEIGTHEGRTSRAVLMNCPHITRAIGIDVLPGYVTACAVQRRERPAHPGHLANGHPAYKLMLRKLGSFEVEPADLGECSVVYIDGDHGATAVAHDTELARSVLRRGGLIIWHDYHGQGTVEVKPVLEAMHKAGHDIKHVANTWLAFERV